MPELETPNGSATGLAGALADTVARRLAAIAEPTRLRLIAELHRRKTSTVHELAAAVGGSMQNVSKHLQVLHQAGLVSRHKRATSVHYELSDQAIAALVGHSVRVLGNRRGSAPESSD